MNYPKSDYENLLEENKQLRLRLTPPRLSDGGVCIALHEGSVCNNHPDYEVFCPVISTKPFILCKMHKMMAVTTFYTLGLWFKEYEHNYQGKQLSLIRG